MQKFHSQLLSVWSKNLEKLGPKDQELGVINLAIPMDRIPELREKIRQFQDELIGLVQHEKNPECLVQVGTYLLPYKT